MPFDRVASRRVRHRFWPRIEIGENYGRPGAALGLRFDHLRPFRQELLEMSREDVEHADQIAALLVPAHKQGSLTESEIDTLAVSAGLDEEDIEELWERIAAGGIDVRDDTGK